VGGIANLCLPGVDSEALLFLLEHDHRVLASAASSCASGAQEPSHVLAALGLDRRLAGGSLRLSLGWSSTEGDVAAAEAGVPEAVARLRSRARDGAPA
jgi:cysteine desulfurase